MEVGYNMAFAMRWALTASTKRWLEILGLAFAASAVVLVAMPALDGLGAYIARQLEDLVPCFVRVFAVVFAVLLLEPIARVKGLSWHWCRHFKLQFKYPPTLTAAVLGYGIVCVLLRPHTPLLTLLAPIAILLLATVLWGVFHFLLTQMPISRLREPAMLSCDDSKDSTTATAIPGENWGRFLRWLSREEAIRAPTDDLFDRRPIAERIARRILANHRTCIGLLGPYGSGKSSILRMVESCLVLRQS